jgi:hypothetical protein
MVQQLFLTEKVVEVCQRIASILKGEAAGSSEMPLHNSVWTQIQVLKDSFMVVCDWMLMTLYFVFFYGSER